MLLNVLRGSLLPATLNLLVCGTVGCCGNEDNNGCCENTGGWGGVDRRLELHRLVVVVVVVVDDDVITTDVDDVVPLKC